MASIACLSRFPFSELSDRQSGNLALSEQKDLLSHGERPLIDIALATRAFRQARGLHRANFRQELDRDNVVRHGLTSSRLQRCWQNTVMQPSLRPFHNRSLPERSRLTDKLCGVCSSVAN
jgi:hypothetical protein